MSLLRNFSAALVALACAYAADTLTLDQLFTRPYIWGTQPEQLQWSKRNNTLVFLWNAEGRRFLDLYAYRTGGSGPVRVTNLESQRDELTLTADERDPRRSQYPMPLAGIAPPFDVAPDGSRVAFIYRGDVYLASTSANQPPLRLTRTKESESAPQFSPDGSLISFLRGGELYVQDLGTGAVSEMTDTNGKVRESQFSPDGKWIAFRTGGPRSTVLLPNYSGELVVAPPIPRLLASDDPPDSALWVASAGGGEARRMDSGEFGEKVDLTQPVHWSPDSKLLLSVVIHRNNKKLQILVSDSQTGTTRPVFDDSDDRWVFGSAALWSPDGREILFTSERDGFAHLYKTSVSGGNAIQLTRGKWEVLPGRFSSDPQWVGRHIYFGSTEVSTAERHFYRMNPDGSGKEQLTQGAGIHRGFVSPDEKVIAYLNGDPQNPREVYVEGQRITRSPLAGFAAYPWPEIRYVHYASRDPGKQVSARIFLPPGYSPQDRNAKPRPAVFFIHGGGYASSSYKEWGAYLPITHVFNSYLANQGYVVIDPDYRGSAGYGRAWRTDVYLHIGGPDLQDVLGGVDYLRSLGNIDTSRLGIWGISYGGFMTNMAMFQAPDAFRAGVAWAAVNDWKNYSNPYTSQRLTTPKENPEAYRRSSPLYFSQNLKNHLLMLHGMEDSNVLFQDAVQLSEKLIHEGKSFDEFFYPEENHLFFRDESLRDAFRRTFEWFERYLAPAH